MTGVPAPDGHSLSLVCDKCGHSVNAIESRAEHWPVVWAVISRTGWSGSPLVIGPHYCPNCNGSATGQFDGPAAAGAVAVSPITRSWNAGITDEPSACVVHLGGQLDLLVAGELREVLDEATTRHRCVVLDLRTVRLLDSTAIGQLVRASSGARARGGRVCLAAPSAAIRSVLETLRMDDHFEIFPDVDAALRWLSGRGPAS
jgi:anti-anti-sigma factor